MGLVLFGKANVDTLARASVELLSADLLNMHVCWCPKDAKHRDVKDVACERLEGRLVVEGPARCNVVKKSRVLKCEAPVGLGETSCEEQSARGVEDGAEGAFDGAVLCL